MTHDQLQIIKQWFAQYTAQYANDQGKWLDLLQLKVDHSQRVAQDARIIAEDLGWSQTKVNAAEAMGWLHDIGRFPQYALYQTFNDAQSFNHGSRAWAIAKKRGLLADLSDTEQVGILQGVLWHNAKAIPDDLDRDTRAWVHLIRDADKLDIFNVVARELKADGFQSMARMYPHIQLDGPVNPAVIDDIKTYRSSSYGRIKSLNDFLLIQLAWVYDINYSPTFKQIVQRDILAYLTERLPQTDPAIGELIQQAEAYVLSRTQNG